MREAAVTDGPDLISLLYRADWTRLSLAADVSISGERGSPWSRFEGGVPPLPPPGSWPWFGPPGGGWAGSWPWAHDWPRDEEPEESWEEGREWEVATDEAAAEPSRSTLVIPPGRRPRVTELTDIRVVPAPPGDDAWCQPPGGWDAVEDDVPRTGVWRTGPDGVGWEVVKLAAGLAAGGLGALLKSSRFRPFEQAT